MAEARSPLHRLALRAEPVWDRIRSVLRSDPRRLSVIPYVGHGTTRRVIARGRVVANRPLAPATGVEPIWRRIRRMIASFNTAEVAGVEVTVELGGQSATAVSDEEGYFCVELAELTLEADRLFHEVELSLSPRFSAIPIHVAPAEVMVPTTRARRLVISDIDDTVLQTGAARRLQMILTTLTGSSWTRAPFPGAARLYTGLGRGPNHDEDNPFFYVSSSPWNLYTFLQAFIERSVLPTGPLFLRDMGIDESKFFKGSHDSHKLAAIREVLDTHAPPVVLIGDTGQRDPEIYRNVARDHPGRIEAILLRHVAGDERAEQVRTLLSGGTTPWAVGSDSLELAAAAEGFGLIPPGWRSRIRP
jgi:phosphatidate phosphatase APP1